MSANDPPSGAMYLYDYAESPLPPGEYRFEASTTIEKTGHPTETLAGERYFNVVGPRFTLNPGDIAGVVPPRNSSGPYASVLSQIVLRRRTLPWERVIAKTLPAPAGAGALPNQNPAYPTPWLALLLLVDGEDYELKPNLPLESVLPGAVFKAIGSPPNVLVEALDIERSLLDAILPAREELQLLSHVRQVNAEDRELSVEGSDGWFSVVVGNRLPMPGKKCRMVLVSLEGRTDLVATNPPNFVSSKGGGFEGLFNNDLFVLLDPNEAPPPMRYDPSLMRLDAPPAVATAAKFTRNRGVEERFILTSPMVRRAKLVALHSWTFTCDGEGDFMGLMQRLDVGLIGKTVAAHGGKPQVADTGHIPVALGTRGGTQETALYRGPLVPMPLQRDPDGPYHSADQARRIAPEAGTQDISYAAAFEVGRLLAAADARLAQELMRWRRGGYEARARLDVLLDLQSILAVKFGERIPDILMRHVIPLASARLIETLTKSGPPIGDAYSMGVMAKVAGLQPEIFARAFGLDGAELGREVLVGLAEPLGGRLPVKIDAVVKGGSMAEVLKDFEGLSVLQGARVGLIENVRTRMGAFGKPNTVPTGPIGTAPRGRRNVGKAASKTNTGGRGR